MTAHNAQLAHGHKWEEMRHQARAVSGQITELCSQNDRLGREIALAIARSKGLATGAVAVLARLGYVPSSEPLCDAETWRVNGSAVTPSHEKGAQDSGACDAVSTAEEQSDSDSSSSDANNDGGKGEGEEEAPLEDDLHGGGPGGGGISGGARHLCKEHQSSFVVRVASDNEHNEPS